MAKGRKPVSANPVTMQTEIYRIESENTFAMRGDLFAALFKSDWNQNAEVPMAEGTIPAKFAAWGLECVTPKGKRGGEGGDFGRSQGIKPNTNRKRRGISSDISAKIYDNLPKWANEERALKLLEKAENGSMKAMVALKCLDCVVWQPKEIRECQSSDCSLYSIRPFQGKKAMAGEESELVPAGAE